MSACSHLLSMGSTCTLIFITLWVVGYKYSSLLPTLIPVCTYC